jgi:inorganic triphosphatase YgiF
MDAEPREIELKFAVHGLRAGALPACLAKLAEAPARRLVSVYYDTPKRSLRRAGMVLRVRRSDARFVQTLKTRDDGALARGEWETDIAGAEPSPAALSDTPAAHILRSSGELAPQFTIEVLRRTLNLREAGSRIEIAFDEGTASAGDRRAPFTELELELKSGTLEDLFSLARRISLGADLTVSFVTKAERGFALATPPRSRASKFEAPPLTKAMSAGEAFAWVARACLRQITANAEQLRRRPSPEVLHQLRVALRRLRSLITTFKTVVADARAPALKAELKWLTGELDAARNLDVLLKGDLRAAFAGRDATPDLRDLGARLRGARRMAYVRAASAVESERFRRLALDLLVWIEAGAWRRHGPREQPLGPFARAALDHQRRKILKKGRHVRRLRPDERHGLRIDAKKMRYATDVFAAVFDHPKRARRFVKSLKAVQDVLGELNDRVVGEALTQDVAAGAGWTEADAALLAGRVSAPRKGQTSELLAKAQKSLDAFAEARKFWPR